MDQNIIGLCGSFNNKKQMVNLEYINKVIDNGYLPLILPYKITKEMAENYIKVIKGIIFCGGDDINPKRYGEKKHKKLGKINKQRDESELNLFEVAYENNIPIFGICRGMQLSNVALGGSLYQDIKNQYNTSLDHKKSRHNINIVENTKLNKICNGVIKHNVNSYHHQAIKEISDYLIASSYAPDGIIESVESSCGKNLIAVQWHPEKEENDISNALFKYFFNMVEQHRDKTNEE